MARRVALFEPYAFDRAYGNQNYILAMTRYIDRSRYSPVFVCQSDSLLRKSLEDAGIETAIVPAPLRLQRFGGTLLRHDLVGAVSTAVSLSRYTMRLHAFLTEKHIDLVHCNNLRALLVIGIAARVARKPVVWYVKGHLDNPRIDRLAFSLADRILFQAESNKNRRYPDLVARYRRKIRVVPNGVDLAKIEEAERVDVEPLRRELHVDPQDLNVAYLGALSPLKGIHVLLEAAREVRRCEPRFKLHLIGDHGASEYVPYSSAMQRAVREENAEWVRFTGYRDDALSVLRLVDALVLPSLSEGVPRSLLEAMALGKPVVSTRVGGIPDLVQDGYSGLLVPPNDAGALAAALIKLLGNPDMRRMFGARGREHVYAHHSIVGNVNALMNVYDSLLTPSAGPLA